MVGWDAPGSTRCTLRQASQTAQGRRERCGNLGLYSAAFEMESYFQYWPRSSRRHRGYLLETYNVTWQLFVAILVRSRNVELRPQSSGEAVTLQGPPTRPLV